MRPSARHSMPFCESEDDSGMRRGNPLQNSRLLTDIEQEWIV